MTALGIHNGNSKWMREYNGRNGGVSVPVKRSLRDELNSEYSSLSMIARPLKNSRNKTEAALYKKTAAKMADIAEQLTLLDACEMGYIQPVIGGAMELNRGTE
jgi:hypothetical protein